MSLSDTLRSLSDRFMRDFSSRGAFGEAASFARALREAARDAYRLECAKLQYDELLEVATDLDAHAIIAPPVDLERALRSGKSRDLSHSRLPIAADRSNPIARAAGDIPGTNITIFPVLPRERPIVVEFGRDLGD